MSNVFVVMSEHDFEWDRVPVGVAATLEQARELAAWHLEQQDPSAPPLVWDDDTMAAVSRAAMQEGSIDLPDYTIHHHVHMMRSTGR